MRATALGLLCCFPALAWAHPQDQAFLELQGRGEVVQARLELALPLALELAQIPGAADLSPAGLDRLAPALFAATLGSGELRVEAGPCRWGAPQASASGLRLELAAAARCPEPPGELSWSLPFVNQAPPTFRITGAADLDGIRQELSLAPGRQTLVLQGPPPAASTELLRGLFRWLSWTGLLALLGFLAAGLATDPKPRIRILATLASGIALAVLIRSRMAGFPAPTAVGALGVLVLAGGAVLRGDAAQRFRNALPAGAALGFALGPRTWLQAPGLLLGMAIAAGLGFALGAVSRWARPLAVLLGLAAVGVAVLTVR